MAIDRAGTRLNLGIGGSFMDEAQVDSSAAGAPSGKANRLVVAPGEAESTGRFQTWEAAGGQFRAHSHDTAAIAELVAIKGRIDAVEAKLDLVIVELTQKTEPGDTQPISAVALPLPSGAATEATLARRHNLFASLAKAEAQVGEELRFDDVDGGDMFIGRALDGTATTAASWEVVKYTRDSAGKTQRSQYRTGVVWDDRAAGW